MCEYNKDIYYQPVDILAINETRLDSSVSNGEISVSGYTLERKDRNRTGAGVALYIRNSISYEYMPTLQEKQLEWLCVKVIKPKAKAFIVGTWYRLPGSTSETMSTFESLLEKLELLDLETSILGDFNCDVSANLLNHQTRNLLDLCNLYQYHQLIQVPT